MKKYIFLLFVLFLAHPSFADDTEIYGVSTINVKPNVLIVFDNSGSMDERDIPSEKYDSGTTYPNSGYSSNTVYKRTWSGFLFFGSWSWKEYYDDISSNNWTCTSAKNALTTDGYWDGALSKNGDTVNCGGTSDSTYRLGNFLNFEAQAGNNEIRIVVAKKVIADLIHEFSNDINFGVMTFNSGYGGELIEPCGADIDELIGDDYDPDTAEFEDDDQSDLFGAIGSMESGGSTPLAETMAEAGLYFAGEDGWFNGGAEYTSPIQYRCQKNYIILVTDGEPTSDDDSRLRNAIYLNSKKIPSLNHSVDDSSYLDDVSYFLANEDLISGMGSDGDFPVQTVTTHTIGIIGTTSDEDSLNFLQGVAANGNGTFSNATSSESLKAALSSIFNTIGAHNEQFSSSAVPVNSDDGFTAGDYVYFGLFQPLSNDNWAGNLKKYALVDGVIKDQNDHDAILGNGTFADNAISYWSTSTDGNEVRSGGAGGVLNTAIENGSSRNIYTYTGGASNVLSDGDNLFTVSNPVLTEENYEGLTSSVISAVRHEASDGSWPLGSFIHSEPLVVHYGTTQTVIYIGANDGMLHCFDDSDGSEKWGFIPQDLLSELSVLESPTSLHYFVDGSPTLYSYNDGSDKKILIFGERRGGYSYTALDVTSPTSPSFKYSVGINFLKENDSSVVAVNSREVLGQSWGKPQRCRMFDSGTGSVKDVFLMSGGYDLNEDNLSLTSVDTVGRAVYAIDAKTGDLLTNFSFNHGSFGSMTSAIVAAAAFENPESRTTTRVYAGDLGGNLFAARDDTYSGDEDGVWEQKIKLFSSSGKKIFYPPNITNEYYWVKYPYSGERADDPELRRIKGDYVFYGTGDRAHPTRDDIVNEFYAIKNSWQWEDSSGNPTSTPQIIKAYIDISDGELKAVSNDTSIGDDVLFILDVTDDLYQNTESDENDKILYTNYIKNAIRNVNNRGWFFRLVENVDDVESVGEKVVSSPIIFNGVVYFTTYVPTESTCSDDDPCENPGSSGIGYLYAIGYKYGEAVKNFTEDSEGVLERDDRRFALKSSGIPPAPRIVTPKNGDPYLIIGKQKVNLPPLKGVNLFYWRQLNN